MHVNKTYDVIIIGGSYAGLSAGMALGRSLREVLIIDEGKPCNIKAEYSHNFITQDGKTPAEISIEAKLQVAKYPTINFYDGLASFGRKVAENIEITTDKGDKFLAKKLIFATGLKDVLPAIEGFSQCWGISIVFCPYCHGYEVKNEKMGVLGNGDFGYEYVKMISNWTNNITLFTNGKATLTTTQVNKLKGNGIKIVEAEIECFNHNNGHVQQITLKDGNNVFVKAVYAKPPFVQTLVIPTLLGCELTEEGLIMVDERRKTNVNGVFACGDNSSLRSIATAVYTGSMAGIAANKELMEEAF